MTAISRIVLKLLQLLIPCYHSLGEATGRVVGAGGADMPGHEHSAILELISSVLLGSESNVLEPTTSVALGSTRSTASTTSSPPLTKSGETLASNDFLPLETSSVAGLHTHRQPSISSIVSTIATHPSRNPTTTAATTSSFSSSRKPTRTAPQETVITVSASAAAPKTDDSVKYVANKWVGAAIGIAVGLIVLAAVVWCLRANLKIVFNALRLSLAQRIKAGRKDLAAHLRWRSELPGDEIVRGRRYRRSTSRWSRRAELPAHEDWIPEMEVPEMVGGAGRLVVAELEAAAGAEYRTEYRSNGNRISNNEHEGNEENSDIQEITGTGNVLKFLCSAEERALELDG